MPTYDYKCTKCGYTFCVEQSILDKPLTRCRKCRGKVERLLPQNISLIFKGSGFYTTDYKKAANSPKRDGERAGSVDRSQGGRSKVSKEAKTGETTD